MQSYNNKCQPPYIHPYGALLHIQHLKDLPCFPVVAEYLIAVQVLPPETVGRQRDSLQGESNRRNVRQRFEHIEQFVVADEVTTEQDRRHQRDRHNERTHVDREQTTSEHSVDLRIPPSQQAHAQENQHPIGFVDLPRHVVSNEVETDHPADHEWEVRNDL